jgi:hypothetical protein
LEFIDFILKGDVALGFCAYHSNVTMGNSLDELGRERFHPLGIVLTVILYFSFKIYVIFEIFKVTEVILMEISQVGLLNTLQMVLDQM